MGQVLELPFLLHLIQYISRHDTPSSGGPEKGYWHSAAFEATVLELRVEQNSCAAELFPSFTLPCFILAVKAPQPLYGYYG